MSGCAFTRACSTASPSEERTEPRIRAPTLTVQVCSGVGLPAATTSSGYSSSER